MSASRPVRGRLAPSPTGFLHLGNAWAFLLAWLACRSKGGSLVLRMEDIDPDRSRPEYADAIIRDLRWLGLDWDEGPDAGGPAGPGISTLATVPARSFARWRVRPMWGTPGPPTPEPAATCPPNAVPSWKPPDAARASGSAALPRTMLLRMPYSALSA